MTLKAILMSTASAALLAGAVTAQEATTDTDMATGDAMQPTAEATAETGAAAPAPEFTSIEEMTVGDMLGLKVTDPTFAKIGDIDYVLPEGEGAVAVIGIGGFLGLGEYTVALPLEDFEYNVEQRVLVLGTDKETLKAQPEFDESDAESLPDETPIASLVSDDSDSESMSDEGSMSEDGADSESMSDEGSMSEDGADSESMSDEGSMSEDGADSGSMSDEGSMSEDGADSGSMSDEGSMSEDGADSESMSDEGSMSEDGADSESMSDEGSMSEDGADSESMSEETPEEENSTN